MSGDDQPPSFEDLGARLKKARNAANPTGPEGSGRGAAGAGSMAAALRISMEMVAALVVGGFIGWFLDRFLGTGPWLLLVFLVLGFAAGMLGAVRESRRIQTQADQEAQAKKDGESG